MTSFPQRLWLSAVLAALACTANAQTKTVSLGDHTYATEIRALVFMTQEIHDATADKPFTAARAGQMTAECMSPRLAAAMAGKSAMASFVFQACDAARLRFVDHKEAEACTLINKANNIRVPAPDDAYADRLHDAVKELTIRIGCFNPAPYVAAVPSAVTRRLMLEDSAGSNLVFTPSKPPESVPGAITIEVKPLPSRPPKTR
ncbi:hypothetical protein BH11PSE2_BH11PSE2_14960 [soil metagenome]